MTFATEVPEGLHLALDPDDALLYIADAQDHKWIVFAAPGIGDPPTWHELIVRVVCSALGVDVSAVPELDLEWNPPPERGIT